MQSKLVFLSSLFFTLLLTSFLKAEPKPEDEGKEEETPDKEGEKPEGEGEKPEGEGEKPGKEGETPDKEGEKPEGEGEKAPITAILAQIASIQTLDPAKSGEILLNGYGKAWYFVNKKTGEVVDKVTDLDAVRIEIPALTILLETFKKLLPKGEEYLKTLNQRIKTVFVMLTPVAKGGDEPKGPETEGEPNGEDDGEAKPSGGKPKPKPKPTTKPAPKPEPKSKAKAK